MGQEPCPYYVVQALQGASLQNPCIFYEVMFLLNELNFAEIDNFLPAGRHFYSNLFYFSSVIQLAEC